MIRPQPWQSRVMAEQRELEDRLNKLETWSRTEAFGALAREERWRQFRQLNAMVEYNEALKDRIEHF